MRIAVIGEGGREHALVWKLRASPLCDALFCLPGNSGTSALCENVDIAARDYESLLSFAMRSRIDLAIIGGEAPLAAGLADNLRDCGIATVGVSRAAARLESSKAFAKDFCERWSIPCARSRSFTDMEAARDYLACCAMPIVIKADGLAAGKGVVVAHSLDEALRALAFVSGDAFGDSGKIVVIEEYLAGREISFFALCDGSDAVALGGVCDHKAAYDGGRGPNTGGMGTYAPAAFMDSTLEAKIMERIAYPTLRGMAAEGSPYRGIMFMGLMICHGEPRLIEYNVRFGDPECQILMLLLDSDLVPLLEALAHGRLAKHGALAWHGGAAVNVVLAAENYPQTPRLGDAITLPHELSPQVQIFHAGCKRDNSGRLISSGGRVLHVAARAENLTHAKTLAYDTIARIKLKGSFYRTDIGNDNPLPK